MWLSRFRQGISSAVDFVYPPLCAVCGDRLIPFESDICDRCREKVIPNPLWRCRLCGATGFSSFDSPEGRCIYCPAPDIPYRGVLAAAPYRAEAARCVHLFKYRRRLDMGTAIGRMMVSRLSEPLRVLEDRVEWIVPVPLHWRRRRMRGFNQAEILARHLSDSTGLPLKTNVMRRIRATRMQVHLPADRRAANVRGAFALKSGGLPLPGIVLVDDVVTGGHTVHECARVLRRGGSPEIWVAAFARAGPKVREIGGV